MEICKWQIESQVYTQGFMGWGYMRLCCHLVGSRSLIVSYAISAWCTSKGDIYDNGVPHDYQFIRFYMSIITFEAS